MTAYFVSDAASVVHLGSVHNDYNRAFMTSRSWRDSGATGAVGSHVCRLGNVLEQKVVALSDSNDKCAWLGNELGLDVALNYRHSTFQRTSRTLSGAFFDNVGGEILDMALKRLNKNARIALCGGYSFPCEIWIC